MSFAVRRALVPSIVVLVFGCIVSGCSGSSSNDSGVAAEIGVQIGSGFITIENRAGQTLVDVKVALKAGTLRYDAVVPQLAASDKRDLSLGDFRSSDGGRFNPNVVHPREVTVTASGVDGKKYDVTRPWKQ